MNILPYCQQVNQGTIRQFQVFHLRRHMIKYKSVLLSLLLLVPGCLQAKAKDNRVEAQEVTCTYTVSENQCNQFSAADSSGGGGGQILRVCAQTDRETGETTIKARKADDDTKVFGERPYQVYALPADANARCGPGQPDSFREVASDPSGIGTSELRFDPFTPMWESGQSRMAFCVTASVNSDEDGYDGDNTKNWWHSGRTVLRRDCQ